jgi:hypothetical protein
MPAANAQNILMKGACFQIGKVMDMKKVTVFEAVT